MNDQQKLAEEAVEKEVAELMLTIRPGDAYRQAAVNRELLLQEIPEKTIGECCNELRKFRAGYNTPLSHSNKYAVDSHNKNLTEHIEAIRSLSQNRDG